MFFLAISCVACVALATCFADLLCLLILPTSLTLFCFVLLRLLACSPTCLFPCLPACLPACLLAGLRACLPALAAWHETGHGRCRGRPGGVSSGGQGAECGRRGRRPIGPFPAPHSPRPVVPRGELGSLERHSARRRAHALLGTDGEVSTISFAGVS